MARQWDRRWSLALVVLATFLCLAPAAWADDPPAGKGEETGTPAAEEPPAKPIEYTVPTGSPEELLAFIERLMIHDWPRRDVDVKAAKQAIRTAADRILAGKPTDKQAGIAVKTKVFALETPEDYDRFAADLEKLGRAELAKGVLEQATLVRRKLNRELIEKAIDGVERPQPNDKETEERLVGLVKRAADLLSLGRPETADIQMALQVAHLAEAGEYTDLALKAYRQYTDILAKAEKNKDVEAALKKMETAVRWLTLPGTELKIEGTTLAGTPLDWAKYRDKVVLIDFWAT